MTNVLEVSRSNLSKYIDQIIDIDTAEMDSPWDAKSWKNLFIDFPQANVFCLMLNEKIIGFSLYLLNDGPQQHLLKIAVTKHERGHSYGSLLLLDNIAKFKTSLTHNIYLEVSVKNPRALALYRKLGFVILVEKKSFYSNGNNAYAMQLLLN